MDKEKARRGYNIAIGGKSQAIGGKNQFIGGKSQFIGGKSQHEIRKASNCKAFEISRLQLTN